MHFVNQILWICICQHSRDVLIILCDDWFKFQTILIISLMMNANDSLNLFGQSTCPSHLFSFPPIQPVTHLHLVFICSNLPSPHFVVAIKQNTSTKKNNEETIILSIKKTSSIKLKVVLCSLIDSFGESRESDRCWQCRFNVIVVVDVVVKFNEPIADRLLLIIKQTQVRSIRRKSK